jgi:hypothetical protein
MDPWLQNTSLDIQRSFARKPVFDSEHHIAPDGSTYYMGPETFRSALWQAAIHGQGASTIWVWERDFSNRWGFLGSVMDRPGCAEAVGVTTLDLNRFAEEVTALETKKADVAIVYAMSSMIRHADGHVGAIWPVYHSLDLSGVKVDFISEKQLAAGMGKNYKAIIVPEAETIRDDAFEAIKALPSSTHLYFLRECFTRNEYGKKRDAEAVKAVLGKGIALPSGDTEKVLAPAVRKELASIGALSEYSVVDAKTGQPLWGVEWLDAKVNGRTVINIINFISTPFEVKILKNGKEVEAKDLLSLGGRESVKTLKTLMPVLAEVKD